MKRFLIAVSLFSLLSVSVMSATPVTPIGDDGASLIYENTFDNAESIADFTQYRDTWEVTNGQLRFTGTENGNTNSFILYTGSSELTSLTDYIVEVDMLNSQGASGLIARADLDSVSDLGHGHCGYLTMISTNGYSAVMRTPNAKGDSVLTFNTSKQLLHHCTNLHIRTMVRGDIISTTLTNKDTGLTLWGWTQQNDDWAKGTVGLFAYGKITNGLDSRSVAFDNLKVYTIPSLKESSDFSEVSGGFSQFGGTARLDSTAENSVAIFNDPQSTGTVQADVFTPKSGNVGIIFAKSDESYYKLAFSSDNFIHLIKVINGEETLLKKTEYKHGTTVFGIGDIRAVYDGSTIYGYFLDNCLIKYTDTSPLTGDGVGVFSDTADNTILNFTTSQHTAPDKADVIIWGHSHMGRWYHAHDVLGKYGKVMNAGIGATNTKFWYSIADELTTYDADTVIIMSGSNDLSLRSNTETLEYLSGTIDIMKAANQGLKVILITEWYQPARYEQYGEKVLDLNRLWTEYASKNSSWVTLVDGFGIPMDEEGNFNGFLDDGSSINYEVFADTQHLNILSYDKLNSLVLDALKESGTSVKCDADGNGTLSANDVFTGLSKLINKTESKVKYLDLNYDGKFSLLDILILVKRTVE